MITTDQWTAVMVKAVLDAQRNTYDPPHCTLKDRFRQLIKGETEQEFSDKSTYIRIYKEAKSPSTVGGI